MQLQWVMELGQPIPPQDCGGSGPPGGKPGDQGLMGRAQTIGRSRFICPRPNIQAPLGQDWGGGGVGVEVGVEVQDCNNSGSAVWVPQRGGWGFAFWKEAACFVSKLLKRG